MTDMQAAAAFTAAMNSTTRQCLTAVFCPVGVITQVKDTMSSTGQYEMVTNCYYHVQGTTHKGKL